MSNFTYCPMCATELQLITQDEDGGPKQRMRCVVCNWTHWNNPTPVLAGIVQYRDQILLARNAAWPGRRFALITGFMEAGETPEEGISREIAEETNLKVSSAISRLMAIFACHLSWPSTNCSTTPTSFAGQQARVTPWATGCAPKA